MPDETPEPRRLNCSSRQLALYAAARMLDKGGEDVAVLALVPGTRIFDYIVLASGRSERQTTTLAAEVYHFCKRHQIPHRPVEGAQGWRVVDCFDVVVHAFTEEQRAYYDLDHLWSDAETLDLARELPLLPPVDDDEDTAG
ncbi:MAG: ribosome silencing factor [Planctomycetota bacterium]|nr:MAG: ribosome silencing factor [Planctomycetota bacterium]